MITKFDYTNAESSVVYNLNNDIAPMTDLDVNVNQRTDFSRTRTEQHGIWPTFTWRNEMEIHVEGDLLADSSTDYVTKRLALTAALFGNPSVGPTVRKSGTLTITLDGLGEDVGCDVTISAFSGPIRGGYPGSSSYLITFVSPLPYFVGLTSATKYYWS